MRLPSRAVGDYHVDRPQVYAQQCAQPSGTNGPNELREGRAQRAAAASSEECQEPKKYLAVRGTRYAYRDAPRRLRWLGGGAPPLPIPNRAVKPASADGTATPSGRVGGRQPYGGSERCSGPPFFCPPPEGCDAILFEMFFTHFCKVTYITYSNEESTVTN